MTDVGYIICSLIIAGSIIIVSSYFNFKNSNNITKRNILRLTREIEHALPIIAEKKKKPKKIAIKKVTKKKTVKKTKKRTISKNKIIKKKITDNKKDLT